MTLLVASDAPELSLGINDKHIIATAGKLYRLDDLGLVGLWLVEDGCLLILQTTPHE